MEAESGRSWKSNSNVSAGAKGERAGGAQSSCGSVWRGDSTRPPQAPAAPGAALPRLTSDPVPSRHVFHVTGTTSALSRNENFHLRVKPRLIFFFQKYCRYFLHFNKRLLSNSLSKNSIIRPLQKKKEKKLGFICLLKLMLCWPFAHF